MKAWFADSMYFIAILNRHDQFHDRTIELSRVGRPTITTRWVLMEVGDGVSAPHRRRRFVNLLAVLSRREDVRVIPADDSQFERAATLYAQRPDKGWSMTDCTSFVAMQQLGLVDALTADHHFEQAGFVALMK